MIFNINLTRGQMRFLTCVARVTCLVFCNDTNTPQEATVKAGEVALLCLYNGSAKDDLGSLRYERYSEKVKTVFKSSRSI